MSKILHFSSSNRQWQDMKRKAEEETARAASDALERRKSERARLANYMRAGRAAPKQIHIGRELLSRELGGGDENALPSSAWPEKPPGNDCRESLPASVRDRERKRQVLQAAGHNNGSSKDATRRETGGKSKGIGEERAGVRRDVHEDPDSGNIKAPEQNGSEDQRVIAALSHCRRKSAGESGHDYTGRCDENAAGSDEVPRESVPGHKQASGESGYNARGNHPVQTTLVNCQITEQATVTVPSSNKQSLEETSHDRREAPREKGMVESGLNDATGGCRTGHMHNVQPQEEAPRGRSTGHRENNPSQKEAARGSSSGQGEGGRERAPGHRRPRWNTRVIQEYETAKMLRTRAGRPTLTAKENPWMMWACFHFCS
jgi:hypothetical protein